MFPLDWLLYFSLDIWEVFSFFFQIIFWLMRSPMSIWLFFLIDYLSYLLWWFLNLSSLYLMHCNLSRPLCFSWPTPPPTPVFFHLEFCVWLFNLKTHVSLTPVFLPGKSHGWRNLVGYSPWGSKESDVTRYCFYPYIIQATEWLKLLLKVLD